MAREEGVVTMSENMDYKEFQRYVLTELKTINDELGDLRERVARLEAQQSLALVLIKYVIIPLLGIVAGLVGLKLYLP